MLKKVPLLTEFKGGDGRYRPDMGFGAIEVDRIVWVASNGTWQDKSITCVRFDNGSQVDVLLSIGEIMKLQSEDEHGTSI